MNSTRTARATRARIAATAAALAVGALMLTACGGSSGDSNSGLDGTYYIEDVNGTSELGQLVVKGNTVSHHEYTCDGVYEESYVTSTGELSKDRTQIIWTVAGDDSRNERTGTESISAGDTSISIDDEAYVRENSAAGKALLDAFKTKCTK
ncbi:hypothetical protein [Streptomyces sp. NBC_00439]|uniref:hypothetical protein n=1 Tax=unclassified Streptomyces TaxID=2593676 RepID=UPI00225B5016|nr:hypothetical protein [Streptomyces sp. NBC_00439]MCX5103579.1 hypothetical protein [Streptomyces sp. NBC_00439]WSX06269.1 hypothetical protein OG355_40810 [Streptomyces sp. NBC_00987]